MSKCKYCGKPAGLLSNKHSECERAHSIGLNNINQLVLAFLKNDQPVETIETKLSILEENSFISYKESFVQIITAIKDEIKILLNTEKTPELEIEKIIQVKNFLAKRYENLINEELSREKFSENKLTNFEGKKAKLISETKNLILVKDLKNDKLKVFNKKTNIEYLLNKYTDSLYSNFKDFLINQIVTYTGDLMNRNIEPELLKEKTLKKLKSFDCTEQNLKEIINMSVERLIEDTLEENIIDKKREDYILSLKKYFSLDQQEIDANGFYTKLIKSLVLRDVFEGILPKRCNVTEMLPFVLLKNESLIWLVNDVKYYEEKEKREFIGGHQGLSIRIVNGLYYRAGAFRGKPISTISKEYISTGILGFTTKHIYFYSNKTSFRIRYDKIVSSIPNSNGFTILKDGIAAKQQTFLDGDGWFSYNLIANLSQLDLK